MKTVTVSSQILAYLNWPKITTINTSHSSNQKSYRKCLNPISALLNIYRQNNSNSSNIPLQVTGGLLVAFCMNYQRDTLLFSPWIPKEWYPRLSVSSCLFLLAFRYWAWLQGYQGSIIEKFNLETFSERSSDKVTECYWYS